MRRHEGRWERVPQPAELRQATVWAIDSGPRGLLVASSAGIGLREGARWRMLPPQPWTGPEVMAVRWDDAGNGWVGTSHGLDRIDSTGRRRAVLTPSDLPGGVQCLLPGRHGGVWVAGDSHIGLVDGDRFFRHPAVAGAGVSFGSLAVDALGELWVAGGSLVQNLGSAADLRQALLTNSDPPKTERWAIRGQVRSAEVDRHGGLWVGTDGDGLLRFHRHEFRHYGRAAGLPGSSVLGLTGGGDGDLLAVTGCSRMARFRDGRFEPILTDFESRDCIGAIARDRNGRLWVGDGEGVVRFVLEGARYVADGPRVETAAVSAIATDSSGAVWVGTSGGGVLRFAGGNPEQLTTDDGIGSDWVTFIGAGPAAGEMWFGHPSGSTRLLDGRFEALRESRGHPPGIVRTILVDDDGTAWIGTYGGGLARYRTGEFVRYTTDNGLFDDVVSKISDDGRGALWMNGNRGVFRTMRADLEAVADGRIPSIRSASFATGEGNGRVQPTGWKTTDGALWFPTTGGLVEFRPGQLEHATEAPLTYIESARLDGTQLALDGVTVVPPGRGDLEIDFTSPALRNPALTRFEYRLDGPSDDWVNVGPRRHLKILKLPHGMHTFDVRARNQADVQR